MVLARPGAQLQCHAPDPRALGLAGRPCETAAEYAARRLADDCGIDPGAFGVVWANMRKGHRFGELRVLPGLAEAFEDRVAEHRRGRPPHGRRRKW
ncbi:hypothetical protein SUDANB95_02532 [Actinosynnema sp. ALI-1.44]